MSGTITFGELFPVTENPNINFRVFGFNGLEGINEAITVQQIIALMASSAPAWADITGKPTTFAPSAHSFGSHSQVSPDVDTAPDGRLLRRQGGIWAPWVPEFLTTETDPTVPAHVKAITSTEKANWSSAFAWGNHAGNYRPVNWVPAWGDVLDKPTTFAPSAHSLGSHSNVATAIDSATLGQLVRKGATEFEAWTPNFLTAESDPIFTAHPSFGITLGEIASWNAKLLEWSAFPENTIPLIKDGIAVPSGITGVYSVNPYLPEDPLYDPDFVPELLQIASSKTVRGLPATEPDEFVTKSQLPAVQQYGLLNGGTIQWRGDGLWFKWAMAVVGIGGVLDAPSAEIELAPAHATLNREDLLGWLRVDDTTAIPHVIQGTPAAAFAPDPYDPSVFVVGISVKIPAAATVPDGTITTENVYLDNAPEWAVTFAGPGTGNANSIVNPKTGPKAIETSNHAGGFKVILDRGTVLDLNTFSEPTIGWDQALKEVLSNKQSYEIIFLDGSGNAASNLLQVPLNKESTAYQFVGLNLADFTFTTKLIRYIEIRYKQPGTGTHLGSFFDNIKIQGGVTQPPSNGSGVQSVTGDGVGGTAANPVLTFPTPAAIGAQVALDANIVNALNASLTDSPGTLNRYVTVSLLNSYAYVQEAPINGNHYARKDGVWTAFTPFTVAGTPAEGNVVTYLTGVPTWAAPSGGGGGSPGGANKNIQFNDGGVFGGVAAFEFDKTTFKLQLGSLTSQSTPGPVEFNLGGTFADSVTAAKAKWKFYDDGIVANIYGIGISFSQFNFFKAAGGGYYWYFNGVEAMRLTPTIFSLPINELMGFAGAAAITAANYALSGNTTDTLINGPGASGKISFRINNANIGQFDNAQFTIFDAKNLAFGTGTGTKIGALATQKLAFWGKTPIIQPTTGITGAALAGGGGTPITDTHTFGGYTLQKIAAALINSGILA